MTVSELEIRSLSIRHGWDSRQRGSGRIAEPDRCQGRTLATVACARTESVTSGSTVGKFTEAEAIRFRTTMRWRQA